MCFRCFFPKDWSSWTVRILLRQTRQPLIKNKTKKAMGPSPPCCLLNTKAPGRKWDGKDPHICFSLNSGKWQELIWILMSLCSYPTLTGLPFHATISFKKCLCPSCSCTTWVLKGNGGISHPRVTRFFSNFRRKNTLMSLCVFLSWILQEFSSPSTVITLTQMSHESFSNVITWEL